MRFDAPGQSLLVGVYAEAADGEGGVARVDFTVNGGAPISVTAEEWQAPDFLSVTDPRTGGSPPPVPMYAFRLYADPTNPGTKTITATVHSVSGSSTALENRTVYDDSDGTDRRPSSAVIYVDYSQPDDTGDGLTRATAKKYITSGAQACRNGSDDAGGATMVLVPGTHVWGGQPSYTADNIGTSGDWPLTVIAEPGAKITGAGALDPNNGGVQTIDPESVLQATGNPVGGLYIRLVLQGDERQVERCTLLVKLHPSNAASGRFTVEGGTSGSLYHEEGKLSVRYSELPCAWWAADFGGAVGWSAEYYYHRFVGVNRGLVKAKVVLGCTFDDWIGIVAQTTTDYSPDIVDLWCRNQAYTEKIAGYLDCYLGNKVEITNPEGNIMRIRQLPGQQLTFAGAGTETGRAIDLAVQAAPLLVSPVWGVNLSEGPNAGTYLDVVDAGYEGGQPYIDVDKGSAVTPETPTSGTMILKTWFASGTNQQAFHQFVHPDIVQQLADPGPRCYFGIRCFDVVDTVGIAAESSVNAPAYQVAFRNCYMPGLQFVLNVANVTLDGITITDCNLGFANLPPSPRVVSGTISRTVIEEHSGDLASLTVDDNHFEITAPVGTNASAAAWYVRDRFTDGTPIESYQGAANTSVTPSPGLPYDWAEAPTKGAFRTAADPTYWDAATLPDGQEGVAYSTDLPTSGFQPPVAVLDVQGLPPGLTVDKAGLVKGMPLGAGHYTLTYTVRDGDGRQFDRTAPLTIHPAGSIYAPANRQWHRGSGGPLAPRP